MRNDANPVITCTDEDSKVFNAMRNGLTPDVIAPARPRDRPSEVLKRWNTEYSSLGGRQSVSTEGAWGVKLPLSNVVSISRIPVARILSDVRQDRRACEATDDGEARRH